MATSNRIILLGSGVAKADAAPGPPRRLRGLPPANSEVVCASAMVLRNAIAAQEKSGIAEPTTIFTAPEVPSVSISDYLKRLGSVGRVSRECIVLAIIYLDRMLRNPPIRDFTISARNAHRLLLTGTVIASKAHEERFGDNLWYAKAGGIPVAELNMLEATFLTYADWQLRVTPDVYAAALHRLDQVFANCGAIARARTAQALGSVPEACEVRPSSSRLLCKEKSGHPTSELSAKISASMASAKMFGTEQNLTPASSSSDMKAQHSIEDRIQAHHNRAAQARVASRSDAAGDATPSASQQTLENKIQAECTKAPQARSNEAGDRIADRIRAHRNARQAKPEAQRSESPPTTQPVTTQEDSVKESPKADHNEAPAMKVEEEEEKESPTSEEQMCHHVDMDADVDEGLGCEHDDSQEGAVNPKAARRDAKIKKKIQKAERREAQRVAHEAQKNRDQIAHAEKQEAARAATMAATLQEDDERRKAAEDEGWAAVAAYGVQKCKREQQQKDGTVFPNATQNTDISPSEDAENLLTDDEETYAAHKKSGIPTPMPCPSPPSDYKQWLMAAIKGAEAKEKAARAKEEAKAAFAAAKAKQLEAEQLEKEASVEAQRAEQLEGCWSISWTSHNPNTGIASSMTHNVHMGRTAAKQHRRSACKGHRSGSQRSRTTGVLIHARA